MIDFGSEKPYMNILGVCPYCGTSITADAWSHQMNCPNYKEPKPIDAEALKRALGRERPRSKPRKKK